MILIQSCKLQLHLLFIAEGEILLLELHQRVIVLLLAVILVLLLAALNLSGYLPVLVRGLQIECLFLFEKRLVELKKRLIDSTLVMIEVGVLIVIFGSDGLLRHLSVILQFLEVLRLLALIIGRDLLFLGIQTLVLLTLSLSVFAKDVHALLKSLLLNLRHAVVVFCQANLTGRVEGSGFQLLSLGTFLGIIQLFFEVCLSLDFCFTCSSFTLLSLLFGCFTLLLCCVMTGRARCPVRSCAFALETLLFFLFI